MQPLQGLRILDVGTMTPGKYCTYLLSHLGADVVRVERPAPGESPLIDEDLVLNQGKRSVVLDLQNEAGRSLYLRLANDAAVVVEGNRPGTADKRGYGFEAIKTGNAGIVYCALSGYGATGQLSQRAAYDLIFLGVSGMLRAITGRDVPPVAPGAYLADAIAGLTAAYAIVAALLGRERTGEGAFIDIAMLDAVFSLLTVSHGLRRPGGIQVEASPSPTYDVYAAAQGTYLVLGAIRPASHGALFEQLGHPELGKDEQAARTFLSEVFLTRTAQEWVDALGPLDIEIGVVNDPQTAFDHPQLRSRNMVGASRHPEAGEFEFIRPAVALERGSEEDVVLTPAPRPGEHTDEVLSSLGVTTDQLAILRAEGVVA